MTTAVALERMTDRAQFERLATNVLRRAEPRYAAIIHTGLNADGETIVSPIDGLHHVPYSDPPHYVLAQHTTTDRSRLNAKWLTGLDSDLRKAAAEVKKIRAREPAAIFTLVLTTNQRVSTTLANDVYAHANLESIVVDIWEQSRIADFLDFDAEGHWIRKQFLGISAQRLSVALLHHLGRRSWRQYRDYILLPGHNDLIPRDITDNILSRLRRGRPSVCLVAGHSGYGKSIAALEVLDKWLSAGSLGLWVPARFLGAGASIETALTEWLRTLDPSLQKNAGQAALDIAKTAGRLLICIDDINRVEETVSIMRSVAWAASHHGHNDKEKRTDYLLQVIPIWPNNLSCLPQHTLEHASIEVLSVGPLSEQDGVTLIKTKIPTISQLEAQKYASRLNYDPFLIGLFTSVADCNMRSQQLGDVANDSIAQFLNDIFQHIVATQKTSFLPIELDQALFECAQQMLNHRNVRPSWKALAGWFVDKPEVLNALRALLQQGQVCALDTDDTLRFRHDRLIERYLVRAMSQTLQQGALPHLVTEPHFSSFVGKALVRSELSATGIRHLRALAPLAIFEAIAEVGDSVTAHHKCLYLEAFNWCVADSRSTIGSIVNAISWKLYEVDSVEVLPLVDAMEPNGILMAAGFRNGSAQHGVGYFRRYVKHGFEPASDNDFRDQMVEHISRRHEERILKGIRKYVSNPDLDGLDAQACLAMIGHFQFAGCDQLITELAARFQGDLLGYAIWAAARCPLASGEILSSFISSLGALPSRGRQEEGSGQRDWLALQLGWAFRKGITNESLSALLEAGNRHDSLRADISLMIEGIDHPDAMEFLVRALAHGCGSNKWFGLTAIGGGEPEFHLHSPDTGARLFSIWKTETESSNVRKYAFCLWLRTPFCRDASLLAGIKPPVTYFRHAIHHRVVLGDLSVVPTYIELIESDQMGAFWWTCAHRIWCAEIHQAASKALAKVKDSLLSDFSTGHSDHFWHLACMLARIPAKEGELLLESNWSHLMYSPLMVAAAFRIGTPKCVQMARDALSACPSDVEVFGHGFTHIWEQKNSSNPLKRCHFVSLMPYLDRISSDRMFHLIMDSERVVEFDEDMVEFVRENLLPRVLPERRFPLGCADETLLTWMDREFERPDIAFVSSLFDNEYNRLLISKERQVTLVDNWLERHQTIQGLSIAAYALSFVGRRRDLAILDSYNIQGDPEEIARIKSEARFVLCKRTLSA